MPYVTYSIWVDALPRSAYSGASIAMDRLPSSNGKPGWPRKRHTARANVLTGARIS